MPTDEEVTEVEKLRAEVAQQRHITDMLEQSLADLQSNVSDLEKRLEGMDDESCEWKTRCEMQGELNQQLEMQAIVLAEKIDESKRMLKDGRFPKTLQMFDEAPEVTPQYVRLLERSKQVFDNQLRDLEWRLDQESKAYHKANEERKNCMLEVTAVKGELHRPVRGGGKSDADTPRISNSNIGSNQRVLDVRRGPIRRTVAVKTLPRLSTD